MFWRFLSRSRSRSRRRRLSRRRDTRPAYKDQPYEPLIEEPDPPPRSSYRQNSYRAVRAGEPSNGPRRTAASAATKSRLARAEADRRRRIATTVRPDPPSRRPRLVRVARHPLSPLKSAAYRVLCRPRPDAKKAGEARQRLRRVGRQGSGASRPLPPPERRFIPWCR